MLALAPLLLVAACGGDAKQRSKPKQAASATASPAAAPPRRARGEVTYCVDRFSRPFEADAVRRFNRRNAAGGLRARLRVLDVAGRRRRLGTLLRRGGCDVVLVDVTAMGELAASGEIADLSAYLKRRRSEFFAAPLATVRYAGRDWGVPRSTDVGLLYFRSADTQGPPASWEEVYETAARKRGLVYQGDAYETLSVHFMELLYAAGGEVVSADGRSAELDGAAGRRVLRLMVKGLRTGAAPRAVTEYREDDTRTRFQRGRVSLMRNWTYAFALMDVERSPVAGRFDVAALPPFEGQEPSGVVSGYDLVAAQRSRNPGGALALIDYLSGDAAVRRAAIEFGRNAALTTTYGEGKFVDAFAYAAELEQALMQARARPVTPAYPAISLAIRRHVSAALSGGETVDVALRRADGEIDRALAAAQGGDDGEPA